MANIPTLYMMIGIPASGKSSIAKTIQSSFQNDEDKPNIYSSDTLRKELFGDVNDQTHNKEVFQELHRRVKKDLRNGKSAIYDATNIKKKRRMSFLNELQKVNCRKVACVVLAPYEVCLAQNRERERSIPEKTIRKMYLHWQPPHYHEGFDNIIIAITSTDGIRTVEELLLDLDTIDQKNKHHRFSIGQHCVNTFYYACDKFQDRPLLHAAAAFHDIGKEFTRSKYNYKGEKDRNYHYYQHQCVGAYDVFFYLWPELTKEDTQGTCIESEITCARAMYISNLIYFHMHPLLAWKQSEKAKERDRKMMGEEMFLDILRLHEADIHAH